MNSVVDILPTEKVFKINRSKAKHNIRMLTDDFTTVYSQDLLKDCNGVSYLTLSKANFTQRGAVTCLDNFINLCRKNYDINNCLSSEEDVYFSSILLDDILIKQCPGTVLDGVFIWNTLLCCERVKTELLSNMAILLKRGTPVCAKYQKMEHRDKLFEFCDISHTNVPGPVMIAVN